MYDKMRRENDKFGPGIDVIWGVLKDDTSEIQSIRFDATKFATREEVKKWLEDHNYKVDIEEPNKDSAYTEIRNDRGSVVSRFDRGVIAGEMVRTPEGYLRGVARVTRTGVFAYRNADGTTRRELRHPNEVFAADSLSSIKMIPVTNGHPKERLVTADTAKELSIGFTGEDARPDGKFLMVPVTITTSDGIAAVNAGRKELSLGYEVSLDSKSGEYDGERFDCVQHNIRYNHLAIVDRGRAGAEVALHVDGEEIQVEINSKQPTKKEMNMAKITLDGIEYEAAPEIINALSKAQAKVDEIGKEIDKVKADADTAKDQLKTLLGRNVDGEIRDAVKARIALETTARGFVNADQHDKLSEMSDADIRTAVISSVFPEAKLDGKSAEYIQSRFDAAVEIGVRGDSAAAAKQREAAMKRADRTDAPCSADESRKKYMQRMQDGYKSK
jgi:hypothetical protein